ncbi:hypothetical protein GPL17_25340 [Bradyrhizobium yuanmingense]|nr:hypothetical protein [Bradyrhizobium yuanmingense]
MREVHRSEMGSAACFCRIQRRCDGPATRRAIARDHYRLGNAARTGFNDQSLHGHRGISTRLPCSRGWSMRDRFKPARFQTPAWLLLSSLLGGGPRRSLAAAAGIMTVAGFSPAFAFCYSNGAGLTGQCNAVGAATGLATAVGQAALADGTAATAYGTGAYANGENATATGFASEARGASATATGSRSYANGAFATATGQASRASGLLATATGAEAIANGASASAYGQGSNATGNGTTAIGTASVASAVEATAVGVAARATADGAVAVGVNATATGVNAIAIGNGATATAANQVSIGTSSNTYRMSGIASAASLAAQSGPTSIVTTDANGNLAAAPFSTQDISSLQTNVSVLQGNVATLQTQMRQAFEGTAIAIAMGGSALPSDKKFAISTNWGTFRGQNAMSLGAQMRLNDYVVLNGGVAAGFAQGGVGGRAGVTVAW